QKGLRRPAEAVAVEEDTIHRIHISPDGDEPGAVFRARLDHIIRLSFLIESEMGDLIAGRKSCGGQNRSAFPHGDGCGSWIDEPSSAPALCSYEVFEQSTQAPDLCVVTAQIGGSKKSRCAIALLGQQPHQRILTGVRRNP